MLGRREICTGFWWENINEGLLGGPRHRLKDNISTDLNEIGWKNAAYWAVSKMVISIQVPQNARNFLTSWELVVFQE
jgi:hypothetical protein